jgi:hypothetical protein
MTKLDLVRQLSDAMTLLASVPGEIREADAVEHLFVKENPSSKVDYRMMSQNPSGSHLVLRGYFLCKAARQDARRLE